MHQPLYTQPAIDHINAILRPGWRVFEYGSGGSTLYYRDACRQVVSVEHDGGWAARAGADHGEHAMLVASRGEDPVPEALPWEERFFGTWDGLPMHHDQMQNEYHGMENHAWRGYASRIYSYPTHHFDVVAVDGMARSLSLYHAERMCSPDGLIILDNSCRWQYNELQGYVMGRGWHRRDFWQPGHPGYCTSIFSRSYDASDDPHPRRREQGDLYHAMGW